MTYYAKECGNSIDIFNDTNDYGYCFNLDHEIFESVYCYSAKPKIEFNLEILSKIKNICLINSINNKDRKDFLKKAVEWYIKEKLCIELDSELLLKHHIS